jgi:nitrogen fixation NifU-like protein
MNLSELYQEVILDHSKRPRDRGELDDPGAVHVHGDNPSCGDEIFLHVKFDGDRVADIKFTGHGCAISQASASLMTVKLKNKSDVEADAIRRDFEQLVTATNATNVDIEPPKSLGDLRLFAGVREFPQRVKCAMLAWRAFEQALKEKAGAATTSDVTTESAD